MGLSNSFHLAAYKSHKKVSTGKLYYCYFQIASIFFFSSKNLISQNLRSGLIILCIPLDIRKPKNNFSYEKIHI